MTERLKATTEGIERAARILREGGLCAFPTETVYGLGARADQSESVAKIYAAKGRPAGNPLIVHVPTIEVAKSLSSAWSEEAERLARALWPGPLTLVVPALSGTLASAVTAGGDTVGLRVPSHPVATALLLEAGVPVAAPSANRSTAISPTTAEHVHKSLGDRVDAVLDGGPAVLGIESTIVDCSRRPPVVLRPGSIGILRLASIAGVVDLGPSVVSEGSVAKAPGQHARHYAPSAKVLVVRPAEVRATVMAERAGGRVVGVLERSPATVTEEPAKALPDDPDGFARELYAALHSLEDEGCEVLVLAEVPDGAEWAAVRDRVGRASA